MSCWRYIASWPSRISTGLLEASFAAQSATAPSVVITRKQSSPISITARDGRASPAARSSSAAWTEAAPRRVVAAATTPHRTIAVSAPSTRGSTPSATAAATAPAPPRPPKLQQAWSEDMIGLASDRSTATPWAFIDTSIAPLPAPKTTSAAASQTGPDAARGSRRSGG